MLSSFIFDYPVLWFNFLQFFLYLLQLSFLSSEIRNQNCSRGCARPDSFPELFADIEEV